MKIHSKKMRARQTLPLALALFLVACGSDVTINSASSNEVTTSSGTGSSAGSPSTFACGHSPPTVTCKLGVEYCMITDSGSDIAPACQPIPQVCSSGDLCACADLHPACALPLGDGPGAYTCGMNSDGSYEIECFG